MKHLTYTFFLYLTCVWHYAYAFSNCAWLQKKICSRVLIYIIAETSCFFFQTDHVIFVLMFSVLSTSPTIVREAPWGCAHCSLKMSFSPLPPLMRSFPAAGVMWTTETFSTMRSIKTCIFWCIISTPLYENILNYFISIFWKEGTHSIFKIIKISVCLCYPQPTRGIATYNCLATYTKIAGA